MRLVLGSSNESLTTKSLTFDSAQRILSQSPNHATNHRNPYGNPWLRLISGGPLSRHSTTQRVSLPVYRALSTQGLRHRDDLSLTTPNETAGGPTISKFDLQASVASKAYRGPGGLIGNDYAA
jgi:hypothetical protein